MAIPTQRFDRLCEIWHDDAYWPRRIEYINSVSADRPISTTDGNGPLVLRHGGRHHFRMLSIRQQNL